MSDHYSVEFQENAEGWWPAKCNCGVDLGLFPEAEIAIDELMDHARSVGRCEAREQEAS